MGHVCPSALNPAALACPPALVNTFLRLTRNPAMFQSPSERASPVSTPSARAVTTMVPRLKILQSLLASVPPIPEGTCPT